MALDKWKVEQGNDPTLPFLYPALTRRCLIEKENFSELKCPEIRPYLKGLKQL